MIKTQLVKKTIITLLLVMIIFLALSGSTMYKQNHTITIFEYHNIGRPGVNGTWTVSVNDFREQMAYLNHNYHVVPLKFLLDNFRERKYVSPDTVAVTLDDGYRSNYLLAYPIMKQYRMPFTIFIIVKNIETGTVGTYPALKWEDLRNMTSSGLVDIESHTYNLHYFTPSGPNHNMEPAAMACIKLNNSFETPEHHDQRIEADLVKSRQEIAAMLGTRPNIICWPFGLYDQHDIIAARKAGLVYMIGKLGYCYPQTNPDNVGRITVPGTIKLQQFKQLTNPQQVTYLQAMGLELQRVNYHLNNILKTIAYPSGIYRAARL